MKSKDLLKRYSDGTVPLYDAIAQWMHSNEPCPEWLKYEYESALMEYQSGSDFMDIMGFDLTKGRSTPHRRETRDKDIKSAANLRYVIKDLVEIGLYRVTPANHKPENYMTKDILLKVKNLLRAYNVDDTTIESTAHEHIVKEMTAYQVAGLIFNISESKVRELEKLYL